MKTKEQYWFRASEKPSEPGEYLVLVAHWTDSRLVTKVGKWNGVEWLIDGRESLLVKWWSYKVNTN